MSTSVGSGNCNLHTHLRRTSVLSVRFKKNSSEIYLREAHNPLMTASVPHYSLYGEAGSATELESLHIESIADRGSTHRWEIEPHRHDNLLQLLWLERGLIEASIDETQVRCYGSTFLLIPPSVVHGFNLETGTNGLVLTIADSFLRDMLSDIERSELAPLISVPRILNADFDSRASDRATTAIRMLEEEYRWSRRGRTASLNALTKILLVHLLRLIPKDQLTSNIQSDSQRRFEEFQQLLEHHFQDQWNVSQYAEQLGLSTKRLNRICRDTTDLSPLQLIHNRLITEAKRCLVYTQMSINEIAYELGYKDPTYFSRFFTRAVGQRASSFRHRHRELASPR